MTDTAKKSPETVAFQVRMRPGLKQRLTAAAAANATSLNGEVVGRIEGSFRNYEVVGNILDLLFDGPDGLALAKMWSSVRSQAERLTGKKFDGDYETFAIARAAMIAGLEIYEPDKSAEWEQRASRAREATAAYLDEVAKSGNPPDNYLAVMAGAPISPEQEVTLAGLELAKRLFSTEAVRRNPTLPGLDEPVTARSNVRPAKTQTGASNGRI